MTCESSVRLELVLESPYKGNNLSNHNSGARKKEKKRGLRAESRHMWYLSSQMEESMTEAGGQWKENQERAESQRLGRGVFKRE